MNHLIPPPHSADAEHAVVLGILRDHRLWPLAEQDLTERDFYLSNTRTVWLAMRTLSDAGKPITLPLVRDALAAGRLAEHHDGVRVADWLAEMEGEFGDTLCASPGTYPVYAKALTERRVLRELLGAAYDLPAIVHMDGETVEEKLAAAQQLVLGVGRDERGPARAMRELLHAAVAGVIERSEAKPGALGLPFPWDALNTRLLGARPGHLIVVAGRPAMGKTAFALQWSLHAASTGRRALFFSLEMSGEELAERLMAAHGEVALRAIRTGEVVSHRALTDRWEAATKELATMPLVVDERPALTAAQVRARVRQEAAKEPLAMVVVDYLQLMRGEGENRNLQVAGITQAMKALAKEAKLPVVLLSQLNRDLEKRRDKRPTMADLRDSGSIEQDADTILFLYRDEVYTGQRSHWPGLCEVITGKARHASIGTDWLRSRLDVQRFETLPGPPPSPMVSAADDDDDGGFAL